MPPVIGAAVAAGISTAFASSAVIAGASFLGMSGAMAFFAQQFVLNLALSYASKALAPKVKTPDITVRGRDAQFKQPITARDVVYGEVRQTGPMVYVESTDNDEYLHMVIALAGHECQGITTYYFDDEELTLDSNGFVTAPSKYAVADESDPSLARIKLHLGEADQQADSDLVAESDGKWTNSHRLREVCYIYMRLKFNADAFPNGVPNFSAVLQGKKVYDNRITATGYSNNPALCILDYIRNDEYGLGAPDSEIDFDSFDDAADICDETVLKLGGGTENRYTLNGVVDTADSPKSILSQMLTACAGSLVYSGGKWVLKAGAYTSPVREITLDDIIGEINIQTRTSRRNGYNAVKGVFVSPEFNWQPTDYPAITSAVFEEDDNSERKFLDLELPYTTSAAMAQRIAKQTLYKERQQIGVQIRCHLSMIDTKIGDNIQLTVPRMGWDQKVFEIIGWTLSPDPEGMAVDLSLKETSSAVYSWNAEERELELDNSNLPNPFNVVSPGISLTDDLRSFNEDAVTFLIVEVTSSSSFVTEFEVQAKKSTDANYVNLGRASGNIFELANVEDDAVYEVRARAINSLGVKSEWTEASRTIVGKASPPNDVSDFKVNIIGSEAHLSWTAVTDLDLSHYRIRHSAATTGATYSNALDLARKVSRPATSVVVEALTGTYFIKAVDKLGNTSTNATSSVALVNKVSAQNVVETLDESAFNGALTDVVVSSGSLLLDTGETQGIYLFENDTDLGSKYQCRLTSYVEIERFDRSNLFDSAGGLFDDRAGTFDGDVQDFDDTSVDIQVRWTDDNPTQTPTWSDWQSFSVTEIAARGFQFRAVLRSDNTNVSPQINDLNVTVDMPDRTVAESDIDSTTTASGYDVVFSPAFKSLQGIGISASNLGTGDYYEITNKSVSGFTITFKNSGGTVIDRNFDYVARGYGEII